MSFVKLSLAALLAVSASAAPSPHHSSPKTDVVASTYFAGYHANRGFPVKDMPWKKYTDVKYAFAETSDDGSLDLSKSAPDQLPVFVEAARKNKVKVQVSIGGWTGSRFFSSSIGSAENRTAFVKTCLDFVEKYKLDGLDFDWEYPNRQGLGCNVINKDDTANFIKFLEELRKKEPKPLFLTAATSLNPWLDADGVSSTNGALKPFADALDYLMIMGYDIYGGWAETGGPNAPLKSSCDKDRNTQGGIMEGVDNWINAGIPVNKLVLGVPAYGHGFSVTPDNAFTGPDKELNAYPPQNNSRRFQGSSWDNDPAIDDCGNPQPPSGTYPIWSMVKEAKFLDDKGKPKEGIFSGYDDCSQTPFLYDEKDQIWVSYDNVKSLTAKGKYINSTGLAGFSMWEAGGDHKNIVVNAIREAVGL